jgi:hypothetical protein
MDSSSGRQFVHPVLLWNAFRAEFKIKGLYEVYNYKMQSFQYIEKNIKYSSLVRYIQITIQLINDNFSSNN